MLTGADMNSQKVINVGSPTAANDGATKGYVDNLINGLVWHPECRLSINSNITISNPGTSTFDSVTASNGDRLLLRGQSTASQNGPWVFNGSSSALTRPVDFAAASAQHPNSTFFVAEGTTFADTAWTLTTNATITVDTTSLTFAQFGAGQTYTASLGVTLSGNDFRLAATVSGAGMTLTAGVLDVVATDTSLTVAADSVGVALKTNGGLQISSGVG